MKTHSIIRKTLYLKKEKILVIGDLHLGFEDELHRAGVFLPKKQIEDTILELKKTIDKCKKIKEVVFLGDITHSFSYKKREIEEFKKIISVFNKKVKIIVVKGNHDLFLKNEFIGKRVALKDFFIKKDKLFIHGDKKSFEKINKNKLKKIKKIFLGHFHPAIEVKDDVKKEKFKCFLIGKYKKIEYFFLPSFLPFIEGTDIRKNEEINQELISNLNVFIIDEEFNVYDFGKLKNLKF